MNENPFIQQGWQCPICKRVYSPNTSMCRYCGEYETTVNTNAVIALTPTKKYTEDEIADLSKKLQEIYQPIEFNVINNGSECPCVKCDNPTVDCINHVCDEYKKWVER